ncbi:hypothetical protein EDB84DRAFT_1633703 [Lactarius hengduanensis]|nr:hypothetical protein EDB84DRAFT_1633703 [Lactarius hengduanensis]
MQTRHADGSQSRIRRGLGTVRFSVGRRIGPQLRNHFRVAASASPISCSLARSLDSLDPGSGPLEFIQTVSVSRISEPSRRLPSPLPSRSLHPAQYSMQRRTSHVIAGSHAMQAESHKTSQVTDSVRRFRGDTYSTGDRLTSRAIASVYESHDKHARRPRIREEQSSRSFEFRPIYDHGTVAQMTPSPSEVSAPHFSSGAAQDDFSGSRSAKRRLRPQRHMHADACGELQDQRCVCGSLPSVHRARRDVHKIRRATLARTKSQRTLKTMASTSAAATVPSPRGRQRKAQGFGSVAWVDNGVSKIRKYMRGKSDFALQGENLAKYCKRKRTNNSAAIAQPSATQSGIKEDTAYHHTRPAESCAKERDTVRLRATPSTATSASPAAAVAPRGSSQLAGNCATIVLRSATRLGEEDIPALLLTCGDSRSIAYRHSRHRLPVQESPQVHKSCQQCKRDASIGRSYMDPKRKRISDCAAIARPSTTRLGDEDDPITCGPTQSRVTPGGKRSTSTTRSDSATYARTPAAHQEFSDSIRTRGEGRGTSGPVATRTLTYAEEGHKSSSSDCAGIPRTVAACPVVQTSDYSTRDSEGHEYARHSDSASLVRTSAASARRQNPFATPQRCARPRFSSRGRRLAYKKAVSAQDVPAVRRSCGLRALERAANTQRTLKACDVHARRFARRLHRTHTVTLRLEDDRYRPPCHKPSESLHTPMTEDSQDLSWERIIRPAYGWPVLPSGLQSSVGSYSPSFPVFPRVSHSSAPLEIVEKRVLDPSEALVSPAGRGRGDVPSCAPFPHERGGADKGEGADVSSFRAEGGCWGKGGTGGQRWARMNVGKGPRAPYLRAKGAAAVNVGDGRSGWVTYSRVPPFRANVAAVTGGKGKRWTREAGGEGNWHGGLLSGPCGGSKSCLPRTLTWQARLASATGALTTTQFCKSLFPSPSPTHSCQKEDARRQADAPPLPASRAAVCAQKAVHYDKGRVGPSPRSCGPAAAPRSLPSPQHPPSARKEDTSAPSPLSAPPHSCGKGAHEGTSPRPLPAGARRTARPPQSPSAQATPAQPHTPHPAPPAYARGGTVCPPLRAGHASPTPRAPPCPHTQEDGWRVQPHPAHRRKERDGAPTPPRGPRQPSRPHTQGGGLARPPPPHGLRQPGVYARRHARTPSGMQEGRCAQPSPLRAWCATPALPGYTRRAREEGVHGTRGDATRARAASGVARRVCGRGRAGRNPGGGPAHERKGRHIGARVRKGESDGEGVVNEAKRSRGEAAHANGRHPPRQYYRISRVVKCKDPGPQIPVMPESVTSFYWAKVLEYTTKVTLG